VAYYTTSLGETRRISYVEARRKIGNLTRNCGGRAVSNGKPGNGLESSRWWTLPARERNKGAGCNIVKSSTQFWLAWPENFMSGWILEKAMPSHWRRLRPSLRCDRWSWWTCGS